MPCCVKPPPPPPPPSPLSTPRTKVATNDTHNDPSINGKRSRLAPGATGTANDQSSLNNNAGQPGADPLDARLSQLLATLNETPVLLDLNGANIKLHVNSMVIKTHEHYISKFTQLSGLIEKARLVHPQGDTLTIAVTGDKELELDFLDTFDILGTSPIDKNVNFDTDMLVSAARISTKYGYPALHTFCIERLEGLTLGSMERLRVARALDLKSWEQRTYQELSERETKVTKEEALELGIDAYWRIANDRETAGQWEQV
ncbi:unnamed protein product [Rhizoctonia solani]|uniref:BTB domain-containing protein n=1 Tax=Rhizoctonia solani TaxID=456999 RepID=A0A8H3HHF9_9AGAM|nr:unnamed protein product [Rhizoctonia solani]